MPKIRFSDVTLYYKIEGEGDPLVLIHGLGGEHRSWDGPLKDRFLEHFQVVTVDLRGHARSSSSGDTYTTKLFANDVLRLMNKLKVGPARVVGISMGGAVAMHLAAARPSKVKQLVLVDTWARCDEAARACFHEWIEACKESQRLLRKVVLIRTATPEFLAANPDFEGLFADIWPTTSGSAFRKSCQACLSHDATDVLEKIEAPTLVMVGDRDILVPPRLSRELSKNIKNSRLRIIKGSGHVPWLDNPEACMNELSNFLWSC